MADVSVRRIVVVAALAGAVVGGVVAGVVAGAISSGTTGDSPSSNGDAAVTTAPVVRANLAATVQVGGSIGYAGSYTVAVPSGSSAGQVAQAEQVVTGDRLALSADETAESTTATADAQTISVDAGKVSSDVSTLGTDQRAATTACAGAGSTSTSCAHDSRTVTADEGALTVARHQLAAATAAASADHIQAAARVTSDETTLQDDRATLATLRSTAVNPGTTFTSLPHVGQVVTEDHSVYGVSDEPVPLLYGTIPDYRAFYVGMSDGADVGQLTHDLIALGFGRGLVQSDHYSAATAAAVVRWRVADGLPASGELLLGDVVFLPGPLRVTSVSPSIGESAQGGGGGGDVLTGTSTIPIVTVDLDVADEYLVKPGNHVSVVLPNGTTTVGGRVVSVGTVATCPGGGGVGTGASSSDQSTCESGGSGTSSDPTVPVTVSFDRTPFLARLDQAPVNVNITTQRADHVLAVPIDALLALAGGGYGVDVVVGATSHLVGVTTGLYTSSQVQVSGVGLAVGDRVEVPSQ